MTIDLTAADRPIPDESDLRLLNELVANVSIPLVNAAWNAQMSQAEAAARLVSMADRGMPLRLVADGDRNALWQIVQGGPIATHAALGSEAAEASVEATSEPVPTFDLPEAEPVVPEPIVAPEPEPTVVPEPEPAVVPEPEPVAMPDPAAGRAPSAWAVRRVVGPAGEQLEVTILEVVDPAPRSTIVAGAPIVDGYRAVLVRSRVANTGQVPYPVPGDANLVLETDQRILIGRAGPPPPELAPFGAAIEAGEVAEGWSLFAVTEDTNLAGLKWCIRPDIPQTIVDWPYGAGAS